MTAVNSSDAVATSPRARVMLVYTGGTIGMGRRDPTNPASPLEPKSIDELKRYIPGIDATGIKLSYKSITEPVDSSDIKPVHWQEIARIIRDAYESHDGFVVLHGTDTMAYTSSALAFIFENLGKPVVVTGSQLPLSEPRTDATQNLVAAIFIAGYKATGLPLIPEVVLSFSDRILRGCRATKVSTDDFVGFDSPNFPPLGRIGEHITVNDKLRAPMPEQGQSFHINDMLDSDDMRQVEILDLALFPGFKASQLEGLLQRPAVQGVVLQTFGAGNAPGDSEFLDVLDRAINHTESRSGCVVVNVTKCRKGMVEMGRYAASSGLLERGVISGLDMTEEAALAKLYWTLSTHMGDRQSGQMQISQRGEQTENLFDLRFGAGEAGARASGFAADRTPDRRLNIRTLKRAVVRISGLQLVDAVVGSKAVLRVFMNHKQAHSGLHTDHPHCVAQFTVEWEGKPVTLLSDVTEKARGVLREGPIILSVVPESGVSVRFDGLYLALFDKAEY